MKHFLIIIISVVLFSTTLSAQLYESQPVGFNQLPYNMQYDSLSGLSYISGSFTMVNGDTANVAIYDGISYILLPKAPIASFRGGVVRYKGKLYAGGGYGLAVWDGVAWDVIDEHVGILNLKVIDDKLYVMGYIDSIAGVPCRGVAVWNDTAWTGLPDMAEVLQSGWRIGDIEFYKGNTYVTGNFYNPEYPELEDMMMYDGVEWQPVGDFEGSGMGGGYKLLVWRDTLYVSGMFLESEGNPGNNIAAWDGEQWHRLQEGVNGITGGAGGSSVNDMLVYNDELWVTGYFKVVNGWYQGENYGGLAKWNGAQWCTMDSWKIQQILSLGTWKDELFIMGNFWYLGHDSSTNIIAKWVGGDYTDTCVQDLTTAVESMDAAGLMFEVYPNPTNGELHLTFHNNGNLKVDDQLNVRIFDLHGRVVLSESSKVKSGTNR
jgi:hypothetical protein